MQNKKLLTLTGNPISVFLRKIIDNSQSRTLLGVQLITFTILLGVFTLPSQAFDYSRVRPQYIDGFTITPTTEITFTVPVSQARGISQKYKKSHPGIDIRAIKGTNLVAIASGVVIETGYQSGGYGKYIKIQHKENITTLYAHMEVVYKKIGEQVDQNMVIGKVGMTGATTGPHLHFEMTQNAVYVNPAEVINKVSD